MLDYLLVYGSSKFDRLWYYAQNVDVKLAGMDPLEHYLTYGWRKGLQPSADFGVADYVADCMSGDTSVCPLVHFHRSRGIGDEMPLGEFDPALIHPDKVADFLAVRLAWKPLTKLEFYELLKSDVFV